MRKRRQPQDKKAVSFKKPLSEKVGNVGIVLSGGGSRAAYQVGALRALAPYLKFGADPITVVVGSSIGAVNGLILAACLRDGINEAVITLENLWRKRTFRNTFSGSPSTAFFRAVKMAILQYMSPGPNPTSDAIFDPTPLMREVDDAIRYHGGLLPEQRHSDLEAVGVMTTVEGQVRRPLLFVSTRTEIPPENLIGATFDVSYVKKLTARHGFASAALPSVLPPVELDTKSGTVTVVDGGICQNVPVDPAARLGANRVIVLDISGRSWWLDRYQEPHDTRPDWEVPAKPESFCLRPPETFLIRNRGAMGPILKKAVSSSTKKFMAAVGPVWPVFQLLKQKLGEDVAYEALTYVALDPDYIAALIELGYNETISTLRNASKIEYEQKATYQEAVEVA